VVDVRLECVKLTLRFDDGEEAALVELEALVADEAARQRERVERCDVCALMPETAARLTEVSDERARCPRCGTLYSTSGEVVRALTLSSALRSRDTETIFAAVFAADLGDPIEGASRYELQSIIRRRILVGPRELTTARAQEGIEIVRKLESRLAGAAQVDGSRIMAATARLAESIESRELPRVLESLRALDEVLEAERYDSQCPRCASPDVRLMDTAIEFTQMRCDACGYEVWQDDYELDDWYP
jgi:hypothetical protein